MLCDCIPVESLFNGHMGMEGIDALYLNKQERKHNVMISSAL